MSRLLLLARKDFSDSLRDNQLYYAGGFFVLIALGIGYFVGSNPMAGLALPFFLLSLLLFLGPLIAITLSYNAIVGKRSSGELTVLLGLPFSRREVVLGTFLGRFAVVAVLSVVAIVVAGGLAAILGNAPNLGGLAWTTLAALLIAMAYVGMAVGVSANTRSTTRAATLAFGAFLLFVVRLWAGLPGVVNFGLDYLGFDRLPPSLVDVYHNLTPEAAVRNLLSDAPVAVEAALGAATNAQPMGPNMGLFVLLLWIVGPVALGYYRFANADI